MTRQQGDWMRTISGRKFWPHDPDIRDLNLGDITHSLSQLARFTGHLNEQYNVAQHSVILAGVVPPELARWALLHDAAECYFNDLNKPTKRGLRSYCEAEERVMKLIAKRYCLVWPEPLALKIWDYGLTVYEAGTFGMKTDDWQSPYEVLPDFAGLVLTALPWREARALYREVLKRHNIKEPSNG